MNKLINGEEENIRFKRLRDSKKNITFVVTQDCNFRCKYCYMGHKNNKGKMSFETAKAAIDYFLNEKELFPNKEIAWEFIGGEPLLEIDLIEQIMDYIFLKSYELNHPWFETSIFGMSSNGSLYETEKVQKLLKKYKNYLEIGITIDGPDYMHNIERKFPDGSGTHSIVLKNVKQWIKDFPNASTKVTFSHNNLKYLVDSILYLFSLGIKKINSNVVFENVWQLGDVEIFEEQLNILSDKIIEQNLWDGYECSFFSRTLGKNINIEENYEQTWCGSGAHMIAVDSTGSFYPCIRFMEFSLKNKIPIIIGNIKSGIDKEKLMPFMNLLRSQQSPIKCMECEVAGGCAWCKGFDYDDSPDASLNYRATYICEMHKARVRANKIFWDKLDKVTNKKNNIRGPNLVI